MLDLEQRARKKAARVPCGHAILALILSSRISDTLVRAAEGGRPPLAAIAPELINTFPEAVADLQVRQLIGLGVSLVLGKAGFVIDNPRRLITDAPPFRFGATFRRPEADPVPGLVERLVTALSPEEAEAAYRLLGKRLGRR